MLQGHRLPCFIVLYKLHLPTPCDPVISSHWQCFIVVFVWLFFTPSIWWRTNTFTQTRPLRTTIKYNLWSISEYYATKNIAIQQKFYWSTLINWAPGQMFIHCQLESWRQDLTKFESSGTNVFQENASENVTHCGLVTPYSVRDLGQHWVW